jgi:hypothetical protein
MGHELVRILADPAQKEKALQHQYGGHQAHQKDGPYEEAAAFDLFPEGDLSGELFDGDATGDVHVDRIRIAIKIGLEISPDAPSRGSGSRRREDAGLMLRYPTFPFSR